MTCLCVLIFGGIFYKQYGLVFKKKKKNDVELRERKGGIFIMIMLSQNGSMKFIKQRTKVQRFMNLGQKCKEWKINRKTDFLKSGLCKTGPKNLIRAVDKIKGLESTDQGRNC